MEMPSRSATCFNCRCSDLGNLRLSVLMGSPRSRGEGRRVKLYQLCFEFRASYVGFGTAKLRQHPARGTSDQIRSTSPPEAQQIEPRPPPDNMKRLSTVAPLDVNRSEVGQWRFPGQHGITIYLLLPPHRRVKKDRNLPSTRVVGMWMGRSATTLMLFAPDCRTLSIRTFSAGLSIVKWLEA